MTNKELQDKLKEFPDDFKIDLYTDDTQWIQIKQITIYEERKEITLEGEDE